MLQAGEGTHNNGGGSLLLSKDIQVTVVKGVEGESVSMVWKLNNGSVVLALLAGTMVAEGLEPTMVNEQDSPRLAEMRGCYKC